MSRVIQHVHKILENADMSVSFETARTDLKNIKTVSYQINFTGGNGEFFLQFSNDGENWATKTLTEPLTTEDANGLILANADVRDFYSRLIFVPTVSLVATSGYLSPTFDTASRDATYTSPSNGDIVYIYSIDVATQWNGSSWVTIYDPSNNLGGGAIGLASVAGFANIATTYPSPADDDIVVTSEYEIYQYDLALDEWILIYGFVNSFTAGSANVVVGIKGGL